MVVSANETQTIVFNAEVLKGAFVLQAVEEVNGNERLLASTNLLPGGSGDDGASVAQNFTLTITPQTNAVKLRLSSPQNLGNAGTNVTALGSTLVTTRPTNVILWQKIRVKVNYLAQEQFTVTLCDSIDDKYRFGFNGMEKDNELKGIGNSLDFGARMYDSRLGRWLSLDPLAAKYPSISPYAFALNSPIAKNDPNGKEAEVTITRNPNGGGTIQMSSTVFIHGADVAELVKKSQEDFNKWGNKGGTTSDGKWKVEIQMTFKVADENDVKRISQQANESSAENLMTLNAGSGRANAGGGAGSNYLAGTFKEIESPYYKGKTMKLRTANATGNTARLFSGDGGRVVIHENLHLMGLGDRYTDVSYKMTIDGKDEGRTNASSYPHEGYEGDIMNNGWGFSETHVDNLANKALEVAEEKGTDNFYMGRKVDNSESDAQSVDKVKQTFKSGNVEYSNPQYQKP